MGNNNKLLSSSKTVSLHYSQVTLEYPENWAILLSPIAYQMEQRAEAWLQEKGVIRDEESTEKFRKLSVGEYANWPFPLADEKRAETITKFLSLWIFYDDAIEEKDDGQQDAIRDAIRGRPAPPSEGNPHLRCWWELGQEYSKTMSQAWLERHAKRFMEWVSSVQEEREAAMEFRKTGIYPDAADHLRRRCANIGMTPNIDFLEYQMGWELPEELLQDPLMKLIEVRAAEAVAIMNDLFGFSKDQHYRWSNLIPCLMQEFQLGPEDAFRWACDLHNARVHHITHYQHELLSKYPIRELSDWFDALHYVVYGFAKWHSRAPRYRSIHELDGRQIRVDIETIPTE